jgi:hypothetical protein
LAGGGVDAPIPENSVKFPSIHTAYQPRGSPKTGQSGSPQNRPVAGRQPGQFVLP